MIRTIIASFLISSSFSLLAQEGMIENIRKELKLENYESSDIDVVKVRDSVAFFFTVLSNTSEVRIHQMGGKEENQVFVHKDGHTEAVYDSNGDLVKDCMNMGSYNYYHPSHQPFAHFSADILPWIIHGNCKKDPSTLNQRIEAYMMDFSDGLNITLSSGNGYYMPNKFSFEGTGDSETIAFFTQALTLGGYDLSSYFPKNIQNQGERAKLRRALEDGIRQKLN